MPELSNVVMLLNQTERLGMGIGDVLRTAADTSRTRRLQRAETEGVLETRLRSVMAVKRLDLNDVVATLLKMLNRLIGEHIKLDVEGGEQPVLVEADAGTHFIFLQQNGWEVRGGKLTMRARPSI